MILLRDLTIESARKGRLADQVAAITKLSPGTVRSRISRAHGRSLLRNVFIDAWPSPLEELGAVTAQHAVAETMLIAELAKLLKVAPPVVRRHLARAAEATSTKQALAAIWPSVGGLGLEEIGRLRAAEARTIEARSRIAELLGISEPAVRKALMRAHGLSLVETIFEGNWPAALPPGPLTPPRSTSAPTPSALVAQRYELIRKLGDGGAATVWLARDRRLARQPLVALKFLREETGIDSNAVLLREFEKATTVTHPNLCKYIRKDSDGEQRPFLVIDYGGRSLRDLVKTPVAVDQALEWAAAAAEALDHLHAANIWHLDVKPANILVDDRGLLRLTDFGIAKGVRLARGRGVLQATSTLLGWTPQYCAPEMFSGEPSDASDQYSLAVTFCELIAGEKGREQAKRLKPLEALNRRQNEGIRAGLALDPADRFPSCSEFVRSLVEEKSWFDLASRRWAAFLGE